ncbi:Hint domain-containing protein [Inquilinus sp. Marseille-Q2685]|uniref:Hint domain-containing protein n=1 Tax=Inquilinus sp. Marseille-Q2685 TaxID=2866581 RepID=UPI001CE44608|nr:Hint domain-containing protein [Inquilinus sp. Marseille-Q2685]
MLLHIARPAIAVAETDDPVIEAMVNLMPDYSAGGRLHDLYVNKLRSALPGNYSQLIGSGPSFRSIFFPDWQPDPLLSLVGNTGLDDGWWSGFSVAVLCQAIAEMGSRIRGQMLTDKINADVSSFNGTLRARSSRVYAQVLATTYAPLVSLLQQVNRDTARQQFRESLLSNVLNRQLWYQAGMWTSPDWEMFNQYAKYIALGASDAEVDTLIGELQAAGLPVPSQVNQEGWRSYAEELRNKPNVDVNDIRGETAGPIGRTTYLPNFGGGMPASLPNGNCYEFTASSQPGTSYRGSPSGCCFTGNTRVLGQDGTPVPLWQVKPGDKVLTRDGTATVAFVARPLRAGRRLYRFAGEGPVFTETHPFLNAAPPDPAVSVPMLLALDPRRLAWDVPTLGENGIGTLEAGSLLWTRAAGADRLPVPAAAGRIEEVEDAGDEGLFDLNLATDSGARQEFWAGDGDTFYLVSPEFPVIEEAGAAAITMVAIMEGLSAAAGWTRPDGRRASST